RFGQFIAGALVAFSPIPVGSKIVREILSWISLLAVLGCFIFYSENISFPGFASIPPTLATALIIYLGAGQNLFLTRLLALKPAQIIGNISYSTYLWHWPIVVFYRYQTGDEIL